MGVSQISSCSPASTPETVPSFRLQLLSCLNQVSAYNRPPYNVAGASLCLWMKIHCLVNIQRPSPSGSSYLRSQTSLLFPLLVACHGCFPPISAARLMQEKALECIPTLSLSGNPIRVFQCNFLGETFPNPWAWSRISLPSLGSVWSSSIQHIMLCRL